jgi:hypothetical protein
MNTVLRIDRIITILALIAMLMGAGWIVRVFLPGLSSQFRPDTDVEFSLFLLPFLFLMSLPGILGVYFGYRAINGRDEKTIKRLVIAYCVCLAYLLIDFLMGIMVDVGIINLPLIGSILYLIFALVAITVYWFTSRYLLQALGHTCRPVRQSLSRPPIFIVAFLSFYAINSTLRYLIPDEQLPLSSESDFGEIIGELFIIVFPLLAPIVFAYYLYRFGIWLFVEQGPGSGKHGQTHISIASPDH